MRRKVQIGLGILVLLLLLPFAFTEKGDWLGPVERSAREALHGWDMWHGQAVQPFEPAMPALPEGSVPTTGRVSYETTRAQVDRLDQRTRASRGARAYARYCRHCHGPNGDGRTIVGESFDVPVPDLRSATVRAKDEKELFNRVRLGTKNLLPLGSLAPADDLLLAVRFGQALPAAPSAPYFHSQRTERTN
jgi:hypothetical protein